MVIFPTKWRANEQQGEGWTPTKYTLDVKNYESNVGLETYVLKDENMWIYVNPYVRLMRRITLKKVINCCTLPETNIAPKNG